MRQTNLKNWGQPQGTHSDYFQDDEVSLADELGDFGKPADDDRRLFSLFSDLVVKLSLLVVLLVCVGGMGFCLYKLSGSFKPLLHSVICETPVKK